MSRKTSHRVSKSSPQSRSASPNPLIEPLPSDLEADIARVINENPNIQNTPNKKWQTLDACISGSPQASNRILTLIPNFHGIVGPSQSSRPPPPPDFTNDWQQTDSTCRTSDTPPTSSGWFGPPVTRERNFQVEGRAIPPFWAPPSPPARGLPYPIPYHLHGPPMPMPSTHLIGDETQTLHQQPSGGDDRRRHLISSYHTPAGPFQPAFSPVPANFKPYPMPPVPDVGTYYLAPSPEPFTEYSFAFESGLQTNQGLLHYPILPPPARPVENNTYHSHHLPPYPPLPPNGIPVFERIGQPENAVQMPRTPPQYILSPGSPHIVVSPPVAPGRAVLYPEPSNSSVNYNLQDNMIPTNHTQHVPRSLMGNPSPSRPVKVKRRVQSMANTANVPLSAQDNPRHRHPSFSVVRGPLLEQFRSDRDRGSKIWTIKDILGHVVEFSTDQHGSRFIQSNLEAISEEEKQKIFEEIFPDNVEKLIRDVFGNYVVQRFFDLGTPSQIDAFTEALEQHAVEFSLHIYGCRVVQKAIDSISEHQQTAIIQRLEQEILTCIKDANGNHVIQKLVQTVSPQRLTFLSVICDNILALATHSYGCRVLQRCLEHIPPKYQWDILKAIHEHTLDFMHDQYGNYVTQFIIEHGKDLDRIATISSIFGNLVKLSRHKYASNVCEKALIFSDSATRRKLIDEIMSGSTDEGAENQIVGMIKDQYANYVLQRALVVVEETQAEALYSQVISAMAILRAGTMSMHPSKPLLSIERLVRNHFGNLAPLGFEGPVFDANTNFVNVGCPIPPH